MLNPMLLIDTAAGKCARGTMSPTEACHAGPLNAVPQPIRNVNSNSSHGLSTPVQAQIDKPIETDSMNSCAPSITLRRSRLSAIAPANKDSNMIGRVIEVCTNATMSGDGAIDVIIQDAPTDWISPPRFDSVLAIQTDRNTGNRKGDSADTGGSPGVSATGASVWELNVFNRILASHHRMNSGTGDFAAFRRAEIAANSRWRAMDQRTPSAFCDPAY